MRLGLSDSSGKSGCGVGPERVKDWVRRQYSSIDLPDSRLEKRCLEVVKVLAKRPQDSFPQAFGDCGQAKGAYRFVDNERVKVESIQDPIHRATVDQYIDYKEIIAVQDTTTLSFDSARKAEGLGTINNISKARGMFYHPVFALSGEGSVLGLIHQQHWCREPKVAHKAKDRYKRDIKDKESSKWLKGMAGARQAFQAQGRDGQSPRLIHVFDREGDIHEAFEDIISSPDGAVIRCAHNRSALKSDGAKGKVHQLIREEPVLERLSLAVPRKGNRKKRTAQVQVRSTTLTLSPNRSKHPNRHPLNLNLVEVWEPNPPEKVKALHWLLYTTEPVDTIQQINRITDIYKMRWKIEELFLVLKSGCRIEELQFSTADRLAKMVALYAPVAVRILQLRDQAELSPDKPCTGLLSEREWKALWTYIHKTRPRPNQTPPTILQAVMWIGRMGGHLGRKSDGRPGVRTLWRGFRDLSLIAEMFI